MKFYIVLTRTDCTVEIAETIYSLFTAFWRALAFHYPCGPMNRSLTGRYSRSHNASGVLYHETPSTFIEIGEKRGFIVTDCV